MLCWYYDRTLLTLTDSVRFSWHTLHLWGMSLNDCTFIVFLVTISSLVVLVVHSIIGTLLLDLLLSEGKSLYWFLNQKAPNNKRHLFLFTFYLFHIIYNILTVLKNQCCMCAILCLSLFYSFSIPFHMQVEATRVWVRIKVSLFSVSININVATNSKIWPHCVFGFDTAVFGQH